MATRITISHEGGDRFRLRHAEGGPLGDAVRLESPASVRLADWPDDQGAPYTLIAALRWYLEVYPYLAGGRHQAWRHRAAQVVEALGQWGRGTFERLFADPLAREALVGARLRPEGLILRVESDDVDVLSWPWEALRDPGESASLALFAALERTVRGRPSLAPTAPTPPAGPLRVLLVSPRPMPRDIPHRAVSAPLVTAIQEHGLPLALTVVRPPTYAVLQQFVNQGDYDVLHFDGHGDQSGAQGELLFEDHREPCERIAPSQLAALFRLHPVPVVVLTACRSARFTPAVVDPFGTVATELLREGACSVVAMSHTLHRDAAIRFMPAFYRALAQHRDVGRAVSRARLALQQDRKREAAIGFVQLHDDLLPVHYVRRAPPLPPVAAGGALRRPSVPAEAGAGPWLLARDAELLQLERALCGADPLVVAVGPPGAGKRTLLGDLARWHAATGGAPTLDWVDLRGLGSASALVNQLGFGLGQPFFQRPLAARVRELVAHARPSFALWVWDGLDAIEGWNPEDQRVVRELVESLRGGRHRVLATAVAMPAALRGAPMREVLVAPLDGDWRKPVDGGAA